jgi:DNA repair exonuclease SbcCD ATPase subunit
MNWKNFASYGSELQTLDFTNSFGSLWLLNGRNGAGKSTIADVLSFGLFGKVEGKLKGNLANRDNKKLYVEIELISKNKKIHIIRGAQPNVFKVKIDGVDIDLSGDGVQTYLETEIYEIPYSIFKNMLVLSINDFKSFISMSMADKRLIFDKLFGFSILNSIKELNKTEKSKIKEALAINNNLISTYKIQIEKIENNIQIETEKIANTNKALIAELENDNNKLQATLKDITNIGTNLSKSLDLNTQQKNILYKDVSMLESEINNYLKILNLHSNKTQCPTCLSQLNSCSEITNNLKIELDKAKANLINKKSLYSELSDIENNINSNIQKYRKEYSDNKMLLDTNLRKIQEINKVKTAESLNALTNLIKDLELKIEETKSKITDLELDNSYILAYDDMFSDSGLKAIIIKNMIPNLNHDILNLCNDIDFRYNFEFTETLDVKMYKVNEVVPVNTLSTGEKKLADFICLVAFLKYIKNKYPSVNLMFLDEIFSSIDSDNIREISKILRHLAKNLNLNCFVMHHAPLPIEYFDNFCTVNNSYGVSDISVY